MPSPWSRRDALRFGGTAVTLIAGCTSTPQRQSETTTTEISEVTVTNVTVTPALVALNSPDSIGTFGYRDDQFVIATVTTEGAPAPAHNSYELVVGENIHEPKTDLPSFGRLWHDAGSYESVSGGYLVFPLPNPVDANEATLQWPGGEHALAEDTVRKLARPPTDFTVSELSTPDTAEYGDSVTASLTVENIGDTDGTFVGALNRIGPYVAYTPETSIEFDVESGSSVTWTYSHTLTNHMGDDEPNTMRFALNWRGDRLTAETSIQPRNS